MAQSRRPTVAPDVCFSTDSRHPTTCAFDPKQMFPRQPGGAPGANVLEFLVASPCNLGETMQWTPHQLIFDMFHERMRGADLAIANSAVLLNQEMQARWSTA